MAVALGFALAYAPPRTLAPAIATFAVGAAVASQTRPPPTWIDAVFYCCWASVVFTALSIHLPRAPRRTGILLIAANAGFWAGAVIAVAGAPLDLVKALPWVIVGLPARWLVARRFGIAIKVAASWLIAVSMLAAALPTLTPTPGYVGDHME